MNTLQINSTRITWLAVGLAIFTALTYLLIAANLLGVGDPLVTREGGAIVFVAAGCYLLGGLLILLRNRWLLLFGAFINSMVIFFLLPHVPGLPRSDALARRVDLQAGSNSARNPAPARFGDELEQVEIT